MKFSTFVLLACLSSLPTSVEFRFPRWGFSGQGVVLLCHVFARHAATLFFPMALILYDFAAYLSTDLIQPGIINVVRDFNADVSLAPAAVSLYLAGGMALQWLLGRFPTGLAAGRADYRGANIYPCLRCDNVHNVYDTVSYRACNSGHQYLFYCHRWFMSRCRRRSARQRDQVDGDYHLHQN